jgi:hypothetical protein
MILWAAFFGSLATKDIWLSRLLNGIHGSHFLYYAFHDLKALGSSQVQDLLLACSPKLEVEGRDDQIMAIVSFVTKCYNSPCAFISDAATLGILGKA